MNPNPDSDSVYPAWIPFNLHVTSAMSASDYKWLKKDIYSNKTAPNKHHLGSE